MILFPKVLGLHLLALVDLLYLFEPFVVLRVLLVVRDAHERVTLAHLLGPFLPVREYCLLLMSLEGALRELVLTLGLQLQQVFWRKTVGNSLTAQDLLRIVDHGLGDLVRNYKVVLWHI